MNNNKVLEHPAGTESREYHMMSNLIKLDSFHPDNGENEMPIVITRRLFDVSRTWDQARRRLKNCVFSYIFRLFIISIALTLGFFFAILYCRLQPCSHFCRSYFADNTSCSIWQDTHLVRSSRSLKSVNSNTDATNKPFYAPPRAGVNSWYENARTAARDLGTSNCYVCSKGNPDQIIVGYPISGFPLTEGLEKIGGDNALLKDTLQLTLSPLDCLLRHTHTPTNPETPLGELLKLSNDTAGTCAPMKRPKNRLKPSLPLGQIPFHFNTSMICLRRLKLTGPDTHIDYTKDNYEVLSYLEEHTHSSSSSGESIIVPPEGVLYDTDWGKLVKSHMVTRLTRAIPNGYWLCNNTLRLALPVNWTGTCGLVTLAQELLIQQTSDLPVSSRRTKRSAYSHDVYIDAIGVPRGIPNELKAQGETSAGFASILPWVQINKNVAWINYVYYHQQKHTNLTNMALTALGEQMSATSLMTMQNRMVLDMLLAEKGGVCAMFGDVCCTFIPNNTAPNGSFTQAMNKLKTLQIELRTNAGHGQWLDKWLQDMFGRWKELIVAFVTVCIILFLMVIVCCSMPYICSMMTRIATSTAASTYLKLTKTEPNDVPDVANDDPDVHIEH
ncbi:uncharacterized protein LOC120741376 isoform X2 [Simochromis diagramma]|uniref:uncharacterized protein LOC120741376 isoform X2 n=1 Tax=Simochromis diagramma TaxID=43689 RepID=UPI001A7E44C9|nr:uncharacterized protein LOC120741376 isoform X2 [Simochromis diagramma]